MNNDFPNRQAWGDGRRRAAAPHLVAFSVMTTALALQMLLAHGNSLRAAEEIPRSGLTVKEFAELDQVVERFYRLTNSSAAAVAVSRNGELRYSRGYGWLDQKHTQPVEPTDPFRIASVSKPFTAALTYQLIADQRLKLDDPVYPLPDIDPPEGKLADERWKRITAAHLLDHRGGWNRETAGDPMFQLYAIKKNLKLEAAPRQRDIIRYMLGQPLQFEPGERSVYSNFGYCVLGRVCERASGDDYFAALDKHVLLPQKISGIALAKRPVDQRLTREPQYNLPADDFDIEVMDAHGGLVATAPALCQFLTHYWISGKPRKTEDGEQKWNFFGSLPGTTSAVRQTRGWDLALLFNGRRDGQINEDLNTLGKELDKFLQALPVETGAATKPK